MQFVGWPPISTLYNAPVIAAPSLKMMAAQSVSIDKREQQVGEGVKSGLEC